MQSLNVSQTNTHSRGPLWREQPQLGRLSKLTPKNICEHFNTGPGHQLGCSLLMSGHFGLKSRASFGRAPCEVLRSPRACPGNRESRQGRATEPENRSADA